MILTTNQLLLIAILALSLVGLAALIYILNPFGWSGKPK